MTELENNSERAAHFLADLFAVIIKLNWDGNVMFALISKIISSSMAIMALRLNDVGNTCTLDTESHT